jgi:hypothetical protein
MSESDIFSHKAREDSNANLTPKHLLAYVPESGNVLARARLLIRHPAQGREWEIVKADSIPGFYHLRTCVRVAGYSQSFELLLPDTEFERI